MDGSCLLERGHLLEELLSHAAAARGGDGRMVFLGGEAGAGKTSVSKALRSRLAGDVAVLYGAFDPLDAARPLAPLLEIAPLLSTELLELVSSGGERLELFKAFHDELRSPSRPRLVVIEDLHWSDEATLDLLRYLGRRLEGFRATLVLTYRDDEVGAVHPVRRLLGDLARVPNVRRLHVPPLSLAAVRELVGDRGLDPEQVYGRTGGNAYFVSEVLAMAAEGETARAGDAVLARAARLSATARRALEACSITRRQVELGLLCELSSPEAVDECCAAGLLTEDRGTVAFRHEIAREAIEGSISAGRWRVLHAQLLKALEARWGGIVDGPFRAASGGTSDAVARAGRLAVLAFHAHGADDAEAVLRYATAAGRLALQLRAYREARSQFARALPHAAGLPLAERARLFEDHGHLSFVLDDMEGAAASRGEAAALWAEAGDPESQVRNLRELGVVLKHLGRSREAEPVLAEAHRLARSLPPSSPEVAAMFVEMAWPDNSKGTPDEAWVGRAMTAAAASGHHGALAWSHLMLGYLHLLRGRVPAGRRDLAQAVSVAAASGAEDLRADKLSDAAALLSYRLRFQAAEPYLGAAMAIARERDLGCTLNYATANMARARLYSGRWDEAASLAAWVMERPDASLVPRLRALTVLGLLRVRRGDPDADELLDQALDEASAMPAAAIVVPIRAARAEAALSRGEPDAARQEASAELQRALEADTDYEVAHLAYLVWRTGVAPQVQLPRDHPYSWQVEGRPLAAGHRWRRLGMPFEEAVAYAESEDVPRLLDALRIFTDLGAGPARARTAERLRQLGARKVPRGPRPKTAANPAGLTSRELQVLKLVASGLRNSEIAEKNRVSHRTVENQVSSVLAKLGATSRVEAVAKAYRIGIIAPASPTPT